MLDIRLFREQPEFVKEGLDKAGVDPTIVDTIRSLDDLVRGLKTSAESMKAEMNTANKALGAQRKSLSESEFEAKRLELRGVGDRINEADALRSQKETELQNLLLEIPNLPHEKVPVGKDDRDNVVARSWGEPRAFDFKPKPHWELGESLGILDLERGVKISGSRFYVLKGQGAALQRALITWMLDVHIEEHGYTEVYPPFVVKQECLYGTGNLPKFADNLYHDVEEDFWLVPTAEVPVTNLHRDEILTGAELPKRYVAYTPCFRREKMSAGRDVRGIKRGHQFDKVEMVKLTLPENSDAELDALLDNAEDIIRKLNIPYRVVQVCTGDKTFSSAITYDLELYAPASKGEEGAEWLEVSSCSNFRDFQARRANLRFRRDAGSKPEFVHTLNGSGLALPRLMIAILENFQNEDGTITIPEVLRPYMHNREKIVAVG